MQANEFDGNAAFSGGGFMPSQATQTAPGRPSSSSKIVLVGRVSKIDNAVSDCTFRVDDGTGWVECTKWIHEHVDSVEVDAILVGMYVRVYGQLKSIQSRRTVHTFSIRPVTDFNEIAYHFIECIYVHLYNTKMQGGMTTQPQVTNSSLGYLVQGYQTNLSNQFSGQYNTDELNLGVNSLVLNYLRRPASLASETGVSSDVVARELNIPLDKIRKILDYLASEGLVYTTTDDHYKFTDA
ncbi:replication protein A 32 kDa subunit B-like isoform X2 [Durio zibethinus]|uniref:Replication protein A 32 kDa subunit B-like isoform X2 n=1 Tax=Durio zibethinus TaxID=66656 RepID=A0A6P5ZUW2_DURZI|nr:replication protein A 32 kDa subunit B-like isoform X2 [Durio zibethinus]